MDMANKNKIKYVPGNEIENGAITNNNVALGVDKDIDYGPTTDTGFWQGVNPNNGGYTIYYLSGEEQPRIEVAKSDEDLIFFANSFGANGAVTVQDALEFFKYGQNGYFITNRRFDSITTSGMTLMYDPGLVQSYPKGGTTMDNLGSAANGGNGPQMTLVNNGYPVDFVNERGGVLRYYNNSGDYSYASASESSFLNDFTYNVWFKVNSIAAPWMAVTSRDNGCAQIGMFTNNQSGAYIDFYDDFGGVDLFNDGGDPQIVPGKWYNATVRHIEGQTTQLYLDNVLIGEDTTNTNLYNESLNTFFIGTDGYNGVFDGQIGHVARYDRALSVAEIEKNYNALYQRYYGGSDGQTALFMSSLPNSDNFGYVIVDSATGIASGPFDTGVNHNDYYESDIKPLNHSGYGIYFEGSSDSNDKKVFFIDAYGNVIDTYSGNTNNYSTNDLDGRVLIVVDYQNGIMKFFDGLNVLTYTFDSNIEQAYVDWNYDATTRDKTFVIYTRNTDTNMVTWKLANVENGSIISLEPYDNALYNTEPILYFNGDYVMMPFYDNNTNTHSSLVVLNTNGNSIYSVDLSSYNYTSWDINVFGTNKFSIIYTNYDDTNQDYGIYSFDGVNVTPTFVARGSNYRSYNTYQQNYDWANQSYLSETMTYMFYGDTNWSGNLNQTDYLKLVTIFNGSTDVITRNIATGSTIGFRWSPYGAVYSDMVTLGDNVLYAMTVLPSGVTYTALSNDISVINGFDKYVIGNNHVFITNTDNTHPTFYFINGTTGAITDQLSFTASSGYAWSMDSSYDTFVVTDYDANIGWYICRNTSTFTQFTGQYQNRWSSSTFFTDYDTFAEGPYVVMFNPNSSNTARIVGPTGISNEFTLPQSSNNSWGLYRGKNFMMYTYRDGNNNQPTARMIDYNGNTLGEFTDSSDQYWDFWNVELVGETILIVSGEGLTNGTQRVNAIKADGTTNYQTLSRYPIDNNWRTFNDYYWWNN
jgi:hypothetical protein